MSIHFLLGECTDARAFALTQRLRYNLRDFREERSHIT